MGGDVGGLLRLSRDVIWSAYESGGLVVIHKSITFPAKMVLLWGPEGLVVIGGGLRPWGPPASEAEG